MNNINWKPVFFHVIANLALMALIWATSPTPDYLPGAALALAIMWWERERSQNAIKRSLGFFASMRFWSPQKWVEFIGPSLAGGAFAVIMAGTG